MRNEKYKQDIIPGIVLMIFSIGYLAMIPSIVEFKGMGSTPLTNRFVPYLWGGALLVLSVWILVRGIIKRKKFLAEGDQIKKTPLLTVLKDYREVVASFVALAIPGDAVTAMLLGGLQVHNVAPGPLIYEKNGAVVYAIFFAMGLSAIFMMVFMLFGMRLFVSVLKIPKNFLLPVIIVLCGIGAIGNSNNVFDTYSMVAFGLMSYLLIKSKIPTVPMILGFILGPMFEENLRRVSQLSSSESLFSHPISCVFIVVTVIVVIFSVRANRKDALRAQQEELAQMAKLKAARNDGE